MTVILERMAIRDVLRMGHPLLREATVPCDPAFIGSDEFARLVTDMADTLHQQGGIGLAAPQIGESRRIAIIEIPGGPSRYGELQSLPLTVFVNPEIEVLSPEEGGYWEGCLSVPGLRGFVERPQHVRVRYLSATAERQELELTGFYATVFQHEFDHLDGRLYVDHIKDSRLLVFEEEYERYYAEPVED